MSKTFSVMTVHSCIGTDGQVSLLRIAEVIERYRPDVVTLQERDDGLIQTDRIDKANLVAMTLEMSFHFHSSLQVEDGGYGNFEPLAGMPSEGRRTPNATAALSVRAPRRCVGGGGTGRAQNTGATHLGPDRHKRNQGAQAIASPEWLGHPEFRTPTVSAAIFSLPLISRSAPSPYRGHL